MFKVLGDVSLLERDRLDELVREALSEGIIERFAPMLLYDEIVPVEEGDFAGARRSEGQTMPPLVADPSEHPDLALPVSAGRVLIHPSRWQWSGRDTRECVSSSPFPFRGCGETKASAECGTNSARRAGRIGIFSRPSPA